MTQTPLPGVVQVGNDLLSGCVEVSAGAGFEMAMAIMTFQNFRYSACGK